MQSIVELAESVSTLTFLATLLKSAALTKTLSGRGPFTVFAPTNGVFANLPYPYAASLLDPANLTDVQKLLGFHVVPGIYYPENLTNGLQVKTLEGDPLEAVHFNSHGDWQIDGTYIGNPPHKSGDFIPPGSLKLTGRGTTPPVKASNGVVYIVNGLLVPPGANPIPPPDHPRPTQFDQQNILNKINILIIKGVQQQVVPLLVHQQARWVLRRSERRAPHATQHLDRPLRDRRIRAAHDSIF